MIFRLDLGARLTLCKWLYVKIDSILLIDKLQDKSNIRITHVTPQFWPYACEDFSSISP
jgi:hypothetical protein